MSTTARRCSCSTCCTWASSAQASSSFSATGAGAPDSTLFGRRGWRETPVAVAAGATLLLAVAAHASIFTYYYDFAGSGREKGIGVADAMPECAVDFIVRQRLAGHAFVSYAGAGMLIQRTTPAVKVNMDSRADVSGIAPFRQYPS